MKNSLIPPQGNSVELRSNDHWIRATGESSLIIARAIGIAIILMVVIGSIYHFRAKYA